MEEQPAAHDVLHRALRAADEQTQISVSKFTAITEGDGNGRLTPAGRPSNLAS